jgi:YggT family protein
MIIRIIRDVLSLYLLVLFAYSIMSWFRLSYDSPWLKVQRVLSALCDPVLSRVRRVLPTANVGGVGIDLSVIVVFIAIIVLLGLL